MRNINNGALDVIDLAQSRRHGDRIPFNRPALTGNEGRYMSDALTRGHTAGDGHYSKAVHALLESELGVRMALMTTSCTHALEMAALLTECGPGDEVIVPSFTFVSTVNAFVLRGAKPRFADITPDTLNIDPASIESLINERTRAIVVVHYASISCEMDEIMKEAAKYGVPVIEDNAHGLFGRYKGRLLGTIGSMATLSFHETKNFTCGEGGAILLNDEHLLERAEIIREKGTNRARFFRGQVDKYSWVDVGSSYLPSDLLAAYLYAQLERRADVQAKRRAVWLRYQEELSDWAHAHGVRLPFVPEHCDQSYHLFYMLMPTLDDRQAIIASLREHDIQAVFHYVPLHNSEMALRLGATDSCPVTIEISERLVRLPFFNDLDAGAQGRVIDTVRAFVPRAQ